MSEMLNKGELDDLQIAQRYLISAINKIRDVSDRCRRRGSYGRAEGLKEYANEVEAITVAFPIREIQ